MTKVALTTTIARLKRQSGQNPNLKRRDKVNFEGMNDVFLT